MRRLGVDPGSVRTGLAVGDDELGIATPLQTITHRSRAQALQEIAQVVRTEDIGEVVVGLPLSLNGREGESARRARRFAAELATLAEIPVVLWDERLSSAAAQRILRAQGKKGAAQRGVVDQAAATLILQSYLDRHRDHPWDEDSAHDREDLAQAPQRERRR